MKNYVGIDLGTTNSAICTYDGNTTRIWKSPEQNDVTPSAIYIDRRGNKYVGKRAYDNAPHSPGNAATLFKRLMGTSTPIKLPAVNLTKSPEECSAEVLQALFGYLPEEVRNDPETGTVITVPAAFNQMQKDATMQAATLAGLGKVALMQEPVAAVMSVMRSRKTDGLFLVYDLGGGTLDIAIADSHDARVSLLAHGGIAMCGGRDFDRVLVDYVVRPWLLENFDLPEDIAVNPTYITLNRLAAWAAERAKIELSSREESVISLSETDLRIRDLSGNEIYLDIPLTRSILNKSMDERINDTIDSARETISKAHLSSHDIERIVFVGGPTHYKPLRDKVCFELGIPGSTEVNPMTAVAEGASVFAESIDWTTYNRSRKNIRGQLTSNGKLKLSFNYMARTPHAKTKVAVQLKGEVVAGAEFQIDSADTATTSGRLPLQHGVTVDLSLTKFGDNTFKVFVFDSHGGPIALEQDRITITRTAATVDAIPASQSIGVEILDKLGGRPVLEYLVRAGDHLPKKGTTTFKAAEMLKAGSDVSLNFKLWEGEIEDPITDNRSIGVMKIQGVDFDEGVIPAGADLICEYEILDSGNIFLEISVPSIRNTFRSGKNFYSREPGQIDASSGSLLVAEEGSQTLERIDKIGEVVDDPKLEQARQKLDQAVSLVPGQSESEDVKEALDKILEAKRLVAQVRKEHQKEIRQIDLDGVIDFFNDHVRQYARPSEITAFEKLVRTAQGAVDKNASSFERDLDDLKGKNFDILWRQDWFVIERFKRFINSPHLFVDKRQFQELVQTGTEFMRRDDIEKLRGIVVNLWMIQIGAEPDDAFLDTVNIIKG